MDAYGDERGVIQVTIDQDYYEVTGSRVPAVRRDGWYVRLYIQDYAGGMPHDIRDRAMEPFFSSREGHTGLGLSVVHGIVVALKGACM